MQLLHMIRTGGGAGRSRRAIALTLGLALLVAACDSGDDATVDAAGVPTLAEAEPSPTPEPSPEPSPSPSPSPAPDDEVTTAEADGLPPIPDAVRGVYAHVYSFWGDNWFNLIELVETTELNSIVVDVKDEAGTLLWDIDHPLTEAGGGADWRKDFEGVEDRLQMLEDAGGWAIARVACFKDTLVADARPDLAVQDQSGRTWKARKDFSWLNPYQDEAGQWCIDVGLAAIELGFDEVQFDYIRFPNGGDGDTSIIQLPGVPAERPREEWRHSDEIVEFLASAADQIHAAGGYVSADLFGLVTYDFRWDAGSTGQVIERIAEHVDFISPMVYPSHYNTGNYGLLPHPIEHPYETVWNSMQEAQMRVQGLRAEIRPWLEDFSAPWMGYPDHSPQHIAGQIQATYENGIEGWLLWNAANRYTDSILAKGETESKANPDFRPPARTANPDAAPGEEERQWPGMPPCDPYPGILQVGQGNLAGSTPPELALPFDDPRLCQGVPDGEEAETTWQERNG
ncbi:MAG: putative glycoside hydrolase [Nitriliruptorales bacterium]|nr:putative glycoside hydrolase [Nitriliruptorales bacterium]